MKDGETEVKMSLGSHARIVKQAGESSFHGHITNTIAFGLLLAKNEHCHWASLRLAIHLCLFTPLSC